MATKPKSIKSTGSVEGDLAAARSLSTGINFSQVNSSKTYSNLAQASASGTRTGSASSSLDNPVGRVAGASTAPIAADALGASAPIQMPQPSTDTTGATAMAAGAEAGAKTIGDYIKEITPPETETSKQYNDILGSINNLLPELGNKKAEQAKVEKELGIPDTRKQLAELNGLMTSRLAEYNKAIAETETAPGETPLGLVLGRQAVIRRNQAADLGLLQARGLALQGQLEAAQETANRAIDLKYGTMEDTINIKMQQLQLIQPILDKEERRYATALERKYTDEREALAEKKAKAKENIALAWNANVQTKLANKGGEWFRVSDGKSYSTKEELFADFPELGGSFDNAYKMGAVTDITAQSLADMEFVNQLRNEYADAGINFNDDPYTATQKLNNSNKYLRENQDLYKTTPPQLYDLGNGVKGVWNPETGLFEQISLPNSSSSQYVGANGETPKLAATQVDTLSGFDGAVRQSQNALSLLSNGIKTGPLEVVRFGAAKLANKADPNQLSYEQTIAMIRSDFQKAISGATVSEQEVKRLEAFLPVFADQESVAKSKLENLVRELNAKKQTYLSTLGVQENPAFTGPTFNSVGNTSASNFVGPVQNQVKGMTQKASPLPLLNLDGSTKTPNIPLAKAYPAGSIGGQCGVWVRSIVNKMGLTYPSVGNSLAEKAATARKYGSTPRVGSVVLTSENKVNGHVAYVVGKNQQGWVLAESNYGLNGKVNYGRVIPYNSPSILGFINPTKKG